MAEGTGTKGKVDSPRCAPPGMKRRGRVEVRRPDQQGLLNRGDPREDFSEEKEFVDPDGWREPGELTGSEGREVTLSWT